jgi:hypothetical protein
MANKESLVDRDTRERINTTPLFKEVETTKGECQKLWPSSI